MILIQEVLWKRWRYETFSVKMFLNEHFYQGDDDRSQYVNWKHIGSDCRWSRWYYWKEEFHCWLEFACSNGACWCASPSDTSMRALSCLENHWVSKYKSASTTCAFSINLITDIILVGIHYGFYSRSFGIPYS